MTSLALLALSGILGADCQGFYRLGGIDSSGGGWQWNGAGMDGFRAAVADPARFGTDGIVKVSVSTATLPSITADALVEIDCFVSPAIADSDLSQEDIDTLVAWFLGGGDFLLLNDRDDFDALGAALGLPTLPGPGFGGNENFVATVVDDGAIANGPFGSIASFLQRSLVGHLDAKAVSTSDGVVLATNSAGVAAAYWPRGAFGPTSGKLVIVTDVDAIADTVGYPGLADYAALNANAQLALNAVAYLLADPPCEADRNGDGTVDAADLAILLGGWGTDCPSDLNGDGVVGAADLSIMLGAWGPCP